MRTPVAALALLPLLAGLASAATLDPETGLCYPTCTEGGRCEFNFKLNVFASETGYFAVDGCDAGGATQPKLVVNAGVEHCFTQTDETMWFHPLGFAYEADGALRGNPELEPGVTPPGDASGCAETLTCQKPMYYLDGVYLGNESDPENFGLDEYEPQFARPRDEWLQAGNYEVCLTVTSTGPPDIFYFCHIHNAMSGRIKIADNGVLRQEADAPALPYEYATVEPFDEACGTYNVAPYEDYMTVCHGMKFVCNTGDSAYGECLNALDCAMHEEMRVDYSPEDPLITFLDQMIPHHVNAVNMAKTTLKLNADSPGLDQDFTNLLWDIINTQNMQITFMRNRLLELNAPPGARDCPATPNNVPIPGPGECINDEDFCSCVYEQFERCPVATAEPGMCDAAPCSGYMCSCDGLAQGNGTVCVKKSAEFMAFDESEGEGACSLKMAMNLVPAWTVETMAMA
mmetsp:Transcript_20009/g.53279  ORF Transcript_20009/g.53279 Transcript_20009/m.53279 type:complete len:458 (+) Transcript_20009:265-1638(+)